MKYHVRIGDRDHEVDVQRLPSGEVRASVDGEPFPGEVSQVPGGITLRIDGHSMDIAVSVDGSEAKISAGAIRTTAKIESARERARAQKRGAGDQAEDLLKAPMPGRIVKILVVVGDTIQVGQSVVIMEAMKMENELKASGEQVVASIEVAEGDNVEADAVLVRYESS